MQARAARAGYAHERDMTRATPAPFFVKGVSSYYGANGKLCGQWVKTQLDQEQSFEALQAFIEGLAEGVKGLSPCIEPPAHVASDLLTVYPLGDPHFGMFAMAEECGEDFDLGIAEAHTKAAIDRLVGCAPPSETALVLPLGDIMHNDNNTNRTPRSGASLDVDSRWSKILQVTLRSMIYCIMRALTRHENVIVRAEKFVTRLFSHAES